VTSQDTGASSTTPEVPQPRIDTSVPHPARRYNYWLGGKDNFEADRASGDAIAAMFPTVRTAAIENRRFMRRAITFLAADAGVRQFLDIGTGIPARDNMHEVAQAIAPTSRVVYADNDPIVMAHARALLDSGPDGATAYMEADLREGIQVLRHPEVTQTLDLSQPVALLLVAILHFLSEKDGPYDIVADLVRELPSGSYLVASHAAIDVMPPEVRAQAEASAASGRHGNFMFRTRAEFASFFDGLELVPPGIVSVSDWRAEDEPPPRPTPAEVGGYGAVARVP
jgi:hypothetical protein